MNNLAKLLLHANLISGLGAASIIKIVRFLGRDHELNEDFYESAESWRALQPIGHDEARQLTEVQLTTQAGVDGKAAHAFVRGIADERILHDELDLIERHRVAAVTLGDDDYPCDLRKIYAPPPVLYMQGAQLAARAQRLAVVGARAADEYAEGVLAALIPDLVRAGWEIISGGALGADAYAHELTLRSSGKTCVVLGSGLLSWYPYQNEALFRRVLEQDGTMLSIFPLRDEPTKISFPMRNRVIAGLSQGCLVVQAARKSGALITADFALNQGRVVFAVPGSLFSPLSEGCHDLIAQGATIVTSAQSVLEQFSTASAMSQMSITCLTGLRSSASPLQSLPRDVNVSPAVPVHVHPLVNALARPMSLDELSLQTSTSPHQLMQDLFMLQLDGLVVQNFAGLWERK